MEELPLAIVDAFTEVPYAGNPAGVCLVPRECVLSDRQMQTIAMEMNQAETAFLLREDENWRIRWFTPRVEVDLCGHATLASASYLWESQTVPAGKITFQSRSGPLHCEQMAGGLIRLVFPALLCRETNEKPEEWDRILQAVGKVRTVMISKFDLLVEVDHEKTVRTLQPDLAAIKSFPYRGVIVTAKSETEEFDFVSRFFAPQTGVDEDPVTGSAHCALATYWGKKLGKHTMVGYQASQRGGQVKVVWDEPNQTVGLIGKAHRTLTGMIRIPRV